MCLHDFGILGTCALKFVSGKIILELYFKHEGKLFISCNDLKKQFAEINSWAVNLCGPNFTVGRDWYIRIVFFIADQFSQEVMIIIEFLNYTIDIVLYKGCENWGMHLFHRQRLRFYLSKMKPKKWPSLVS